MLPEKSVVETVPAIPAIPATPIPATIDEVPCLPTALTSTSFAFEPAAIFSSLASVVLSVLFVETAIPIPAVPAPPTEPTYEE